MTEAVVAEESDWWEEEDRVQTYVACDCEGEGSGREFCLTGVTDAEEGEEGCEGCCGSAETCKDCVGVEEVDGCY